VYLESDKMQELVDAERKVFSKAILQIEEIYAEDNQMKDLINKTKITKNILDYLDNNFSNDSNHGLLILLIESLGFFVENVDEEEEDEKVEQ
jgi:hypothetical protein